MMQRLNCVIWMMTMMIDTVDALTKSAEQQNAREIEQQTNKAKMPPMI